MKKTYPKLTLVTQLGDENIEKYIEFILSCVKFGVTSVQLREKNRTGSDLAKFAESVQKALLPTNAPLIINDSLALCLQLNAEGLHLGQSDGNALIAREKLGPEKVIGLTVNTPNQILEANSLPINYIGVGPIFPTKNKPEAKAIWDIKGLQLASELSKHPIIAIGGIDQYCASAVLNSGADGLAAIGAFHDSTHLQKTISALNQAIN